LDIGFGVDFVLQVKVEVSLLDIYFGVFIFNFYGGAEISFIRR